MSNLITFLKRKIISSSLFWKLRTYLQPSWIDSYNKKSIPKLFFDIVSENNISSIRTAIKKSGENGFYDTYHACGLTKKSEMFSLTAMAISSFLLKTWSNPSLGTSARTSSKI